MTKRFEVHSHTEYSNAIVIDSTNKVKDLIDRAIQLGLSGIAITDHEILSAHVQANQYAEEIAEKYPDFKIALGDESYLKNTLDESGHKYHFIFIATDSIGHKMLRTLSSNAWINGPKRITTKSSVVELVNHYGKGHLIATTACLGGELSTISHNLQTAKTKEEEDSLYAEGIKFIEWGVNTFGDNFYIECAPGMSKEQKLVNAQLKIFSDNTGVKMVVGTDSHYLTPDDRKAHKGYLNSKQADREVDQFYTYAYLMDNETIEKNVSACGLDYEKMVKNSNEIFSKIENYSLHRTSVIPPVEVQDFSPREALPQYPTLNKMLKSEIKDERYWVNICLNQLTVLELDKNETYLARLEEEADVIDYIGNNLNECLFKYPNTFKHYIDLFWENGSIVGPGRGSACGVLSNFLMGITQLDPIKWNLPFWRYLNKGRLELPDIDIDLAPSKRPAIFKAMRKERGELGVIQVAIFGTETTKSAVGTACRGYATIEYPNGIPVDVSKYLSSLVPSTRGFVWSLDEVMNGDNGEKKAVAPFNKTLNKYQGLKSFMISIENLVKQRGCHASGVVFPDDNDPFEMTAIMRSPVGDLTTQFSLHEVEWMGLVKYDMLVTAVTDKIIDTINLLQKYDVIDSGMTLREVYNKYLHPEVLDVSDNNIWTALSEGTVIDCFQFNTGVGLDIAKSIKPTTVLDMTSCNALMRLMGESGKESPKERFMRMKNDISDWYSEVEKIGLTKQEVETLEPHYLPYYGCVIFQEQMMTILMDEKIAGFTLAQADYARKVVAKKKMSEIPKLRQLVADSIKNKTLMSYIWNTAIQPSLGYSFSLCHSTPYTFVGLQTLYLATHFDSLFWNTACLRVNSGSLDIDEGGNTDYGRVATAMSTIKEAGIEISPPNINESDFAFEPYEAANIILYGLKSLTKVGNDVIDSIIANRPYTSFADFEKRVTINKPAIISLIKSGAFDMLEPCPREQLLAKYLYYVSEPKKTLNLRNVSGLINAGLLNDDSIKEYSSVLEFERYLIFINKSNKCGDRYMLDDRSVDYLSQSENANLLNQAADGQYWIEVAKYKLAVLAAKDIIRDYIKDHLDSLLLAYNMYNFKATWEKYSGRSESSREMESMGLYYHKHELANFDKQKYGVSNFADLDPDTPAEYFFKGYGIYPISMIVGTVLQKVDTKSLVTILDPTGAVVEIKFTRDFYSMFGKEISKVQPNGKSKVIEKSWFSKGSMIMVSGYRRGDNFVSKTYKKYATHQIYKIVLDKNDNVSLFSERAN